MLDSTLRKSLATGHGDLPVFGTMDFAAHVKDAIETTGAWEQRDCVLRAHLMLILVVAMSLRRPLSIPHVFHAMTYWLRLGRWERSQLQAATDEAILRAKARLGVKPVQELFRRTCADIEVEPSFHGRRVFAIDGTKICTPDSEDNEERFGRPTSSFRLPVAFPQLSIVALVETQGHRVIDALIGRYTQNERLACVALVGKLQPGDIILMDRGLQCAWLAHELMERKLDFVMRATVAVQPRIIRRFRRGDYLVEVKGRPLPVEWGGPAARIRSNPNHQIRVILRMIEYRVNNGSIVRLFTSLMDRCISGKDIAHLYHLRWEIELTFDEAKTHLASPPAGGLQLTFRSRKPDLVMQEAYGLLIAHNLVRSTISAVAASTTESALAISFTGTLRAIERLAPILGSCSVSHLDALLVDFENQVAAEAMRRTRRQREADRVVRLKFKRVPKKQKHHGTRRLHGGVSIRLCDRNYGQLAA